MRASDAAAVRQLPLFCDVEPANFEALIAAGYLQKFPAGVVLLHEGERPDFLHVLVDGTIDLFSTDRDREATLTVLSPPAAFILAAVVVDGVYLKSARTLAPSTVVLIPADAVRRAFAHDQAFARATVLELACRYRALVKDLKSQRLRTATERLANWLLAEDARTGSTVWQTFTVPAPQVMGKNAAGVTLWGPSGVGIWYAPTIDERRSVLYVTTGNAYSGAAQPTGDAVLAIDLGTGAIKWTRQVTPGDVFGCRPGTANCGEKAGPDFDFGTPAMLATQAGGRQLIVVGQKSGMAYAMDPDKEGAIVWQYRAGQGSIWGGIQWGAAVDSEQAYLPVSDIRTPTPGGLSYLAALAILKRAAEVGTIVGADVVELAPIEALHVCDYTAAHLAYKIMSYALSGTGPRA